MEKYRITPYIASGLAVALVVVLVVLVHPYQKEQEAQDPIAGREVLLYSPEGDSADPSATVTYQYKGERVPDRIVPDEDVSKRTENSYARPVEVTDPKTGKKGKGYTAVFYSEPTFVNEGGAWYYRETATTTQTAFNSARKENPIAALFWERAYAATAAPFSGAGDGQVTYSGSAGTSFSTVHDASSGTSADATSATNQIQIFKSNTGAPLNLDLFIIGRLYVPFDTSSIPASATITATSLSVFTGTVVDNINDGNDFITVVQTSQANSTTLATSDYSLIGSTEGIDSGERKDLTSVSSNAYLTFNLNSTGMGWIKKSGQTAACGSTAGTTCLGFREGHDVLNSAPGSNATNIFPISMSEQTGTSQDPFLTVTYSSAFAFWMWSDY